MKTLKLPIPYRMLPKTAIMKSGGFTVSDKFMTGILTTHGNEDTCTLRLHTFKQQFKGIHLS